MSALPSPLPERRLLAGTTIGGRVKERAEDFLVDELPLYEPAGEGEHVYAFVQKQDLPHSELIDLLSRHFDVAPAQISSAGMKDRRAVTRQVVSLHMPGREPTSLHLDHPHLQVLWLARHTNKLRRGHLAGNRFVIKVRGLEPVHTPTIWRRLQELAAIGAPDFYGPQRFGYRTNNHLLGLLVLHERWDDALRELLGPDGAPYPVRQRERREAYARGDLTSALAGCGKHDHAERSCLRALLCGAQPRRAVLAAGGQATEFWISALQSAIFNRIVARRLDGGTLATLLDGDLAYHHRSGRSFRVDASMLQPGSDVFPRLESFEISPSGVMPGRDFPLAQGVPGEIERAACADFGVDASMFAQGKHAPTGTRRPLRVPVTNAQCDGGFDDHGAYIRVAFDLPAGAFATTVLHELLGDTWTEAAGGHPDMTHSKQADTAPDVPSDGDAG